MTGAGRDEMAIDAVQGEGACRVTRPDRASSSPRNVPGRHPPDQGSGVGGTVVPPRGTIARPLSRPVMTDASAQDEWDPGRRRDAARPRSDRRRLGWRDFRRNYRGFVATLTIAVLLFLALDAFL